MTLGFSFRLLRCPPSCLPANVGKLILIFCPSVGEFVNHLVRVARRSFSPYRLSCGILVRFRLFPFWRMHWFYRSFPCSCFWVSLDSLVVFFPHLSGWLPHGRLSPFPRFFSISSL